jgi:DNA topoisomerase-2
MTTDTEDIAVKYQKLTQIEHILKRPSMYIGSTDEIQDFVWVMDDNNNKIIEKQIKYIPGLYKIFDEIIVNAYDQSIKDPTVSVIKINIEPEKNTFTIFNDGRGIDVVLHTKENIFVPELIFGTLLTSTSFDESTVRITGGTHGLGAKLTNIFSSYFKVEVGDPINKKKFVQTYENNLSVRSKPKISEYTNTNGFVKIMFQPDLKYFKIDHIDHDTISLFKRRVYDFAGLLGPRIKVYLNDEKIGSNDFSKYVALYSDSIMIKEECDPEQELYKEGRWRIIVTKSDGKFKQISFVNGIYTVHGGQHVNYILNKIIKDIRSMIQKKYNPANIKDQFIKDQIWIFIAAVIENPTFPSQTKDELITPSSKFGSQCELTKNFIKNVFVKLDIDTSVKEQINFMESKELAKISHEKKSTIKGIPKLYDANFAGTVKSTKCILILTEGDSAKAMAISGLSGIPKSNDIFGVFPLRGKLLNVREATHKQIISNEEFINIQKILGLTMGKTYTAENINELRYGHVLLMMDADVDGSHIKGLFINMIDYYWPSLLKINGFLEMFITPVVKINKGNEIFSFYALEDYNKWKKQIKNIKLWHIKYYKGLGTNTALEAKEYFSELDRHIINFVWTNKSTDAIKLAFSKSYTTERKQWLQKYDEEITPDYREPSLTYDDFINKELKHYSNSDNVRSIPSVMDGLKPSQRKVLYGSFLRDLTDDVKVAQLVGYIAEKTAYHHGEASLAGTIVGMAQNFVGSNNINFLMPNGQFGTRLMGGKDHSSPRYLFTQLEKISRAIFRKEDDPLLKYLNDDGYPIEPEFYVPIIPTILVNGAEGIGTGYSTNIPKYNIADIIRNLENFIHLSNKKQKKQNKFDMIHPWYRGFTGKINKISDTVYQSKGLFSRNGKNIIINELPLFVWTEQYKSYLDELSNKYKFIGKIVNNSTDTTVEFVVKFNDEDHLNDLQIDISDGISKLEKLFYLSNSINLTNMHLYDSFNVIKKYENVIEIFEDFYNTRIIFYQKRKDYMLKILQNEIILLESKIKFIDLVISKKITLFNKSKDEIIKILTDKGLLLLENEPPFDYLIRMSFYSLTKERIIELKKTHDDKKQELDALTNKTIENMWLDDLNELKKIINQLN